MRISIPLLLACTSATGLHAQTLEHGNTSPVPGASYTLYTIPYIFPGNPGPGQTWNFSMLEMGPVRVVDHLEPSSTAHGAFFPGSTAAQITDGGATSYLAGTSSGLVHLGWYDVAIGAPVAFSDTELLLPYPCSFGTTITDTAMATWSVNGGTWQRTVVRNVEADGYGALLMPYGTILNVLRVRIVQVTTDEGPDGQVTTRVKQQFLFHRPGVHHPLFDLRTEVITAADGSITTEQEGLWLDGGHVGMHEAEVRTISLSVFPNPASGQMTISFNGAGGSLLFEMLDAAGRIVRRERLGALAMGAGRAAVDVSALPAGAYMLRITSADGRQGLQRVMVE